MHLIGKTIAVGVVVKELYDNWTIQSFMDKSVRTLLVSR